MNETVETKTDTTDDHAKPYMYYDVCKSVIIVTSEELYYVYTDFIPTPTPYEYIPR